MMGYWVVLLSSMGSALSVEGRVASAALFFFDLGQREKKKKGALPVVAEVVIVRCGKPLPGGWCGFRGGRAGR